MHRLAIVASTLAIASSFTPYHTLLSHAVHSRAHGNPCYRGPAAATGYHTSLCGMKTSSEEGGNAEIRMKESVAFEDFCQSLPRMDGKIVSVLCCR